MSTGGSVTPAYNVPDILQNAGYEWTSGETVTANKTLTQGDYRLLNIDASGGTFTVELPEEPYPWMLVGFSEIAGNATNITVDGNGETIEGAASYLFGGAYRTRFLRYNGTEWQIFLGAN